MNHDDMSMSDDLTESAYVRRLLRTGRSARVDYDTEKGLARHLANLRSGAPLPLWAAGLPVVRSGTSWLLWLGAPLLGVALLSGWLMLRGTVAFEPSIRSLAGDARVAQEAPRADDSRGSVTAAAAATNDPRTSVSDARALQPMAALVNEGGHVGRARSSVRWSASGKSVAHAANRHHGLPGEASSQPSLAAPITASRSDTSANTGSGTASAPAADDRAAQSGGVTNAATHEVHEAPAAVQANAVVAPEPNPKPEAAREPQPAAAQRSTAEKAPAAEADSRLEREMQMLAVAQRVLVEDPDRALRLARQGEHEFAGSMFSAERRQLALLALVQLGRLDEARRLGRPFLQAYPNAPWSARLRQALAGGRLP
jgi:hypothetical protein